jgi:hypothetical protein
MAYDFKLVFHGLILLVFHGSDRENLTEIDALMVNTQGMKGSHRHFPYLNFSLTDRASSADAPYGLVPGPNGKQFGRVKLDKDTGKDPVMVTVKAATGQGQKLSAVWRPTDISPQPAPRWPHEELWLDWVPTIKQANPGMYDPTSAVPFAGYKQPNITACIRLLQGELSAADIARNRAGNYMIWKFKPAGSGKPIISQALAKSMVLRLTGLTNSVEINIQHQGVPIRNCNLRSLDSGGEVIASVTNLPKDEPDPDKRLTHFAMYYDVANWPSGSPPPPDALNLPEAPQNLDTSQGTVCTGGKGGGTGS